MKKIIDIVFQAMLNDHSLRLHKNRDRLVDVVQKQCQKLLGKRCSYESITRAQRKLWNDWVCLPETPAEYMQWLKSRGQRQTFVQYYTKIKRNEV